MNCPKCGAEVDYYGTYGGFRVYLCGTSEYEGGEHREVRQECLRRQIAAVTAERDDLLRRREAVDIWATKTTDEIFRLREALEWIVKDRQDDEYLPTWEEVESVVKAALDEGRK